MSRIAWSRGYQEHIRGREEIRADTWQACADAMQDALMKAIGLPAGMLTIGGGSAAAAMVQQEMRDDMIRDCERALLGRRRA
jgi:hypothetical protein